MSIKLYEVIPPAEEYWRKEAIKWRRSAYAGWCAFAVVIIILIASLSVEIAHIIGALL